MALGTRGKKGSVLNSSHMKKIEPYNGVNVVNMTLKMGTTVRII